MKGELDNSESLDRGLTRVHNIMALTSTLTSVTCTCSGQSKPRVMVFLLSTSRIPVRLASNAAMLYSDRSVLSF